MFAVSSISATLTQYDGKRLFTEHIIFEIELEDARSTWEQQKQKQSSQLDPKHTYAHGFNTIFNGFTMNNPILYTAKIQVVKATYVCLCEPAFV